MIGGNAAVYTAAASAVAIIASSPAAVATEVATSAASSEWNSSPFKLRSIAENSLGLLARNCAVTYCGVGVSGLDLWVRFQQVCTTEVLTTLYSQETGTDIPPRPAEMWSNLSAVVLCLLVAAVGLVLGYRVGTTYASMQMQKGSFLLAPA